jgi:hypothetical protein
MSDEHSACDPKLTAKVYDIFSVAVERCVFFRLVSAKIRLPGPDVIKQDDPEVFFESGVHEPPHILIASKPMREYHRALARPGDLGIVSRCHTH